MKKITVSIILSTTIIVFLFGVIYFVVFNSDEDAEKKLDMISVRNNQLNDSEINNITTGVIDLKNGFTLTKVDGWLGEYSYKDAINIFKFGSQAQIFSFYPIENQGGFYGPIVTITTFTIDDRLSAKDVTNLLQDQKIADKIENSTNECYFRSSISDLKGIDYYAFKQDNTDLTQCDSPATEIGIVETIIMKNIGDNNVLVIDLVTSNRLDHNEYHLSLMDFISEVSYQGSEISFIN